MRGTFQFVLRRQFEGIDDLVAAIGHQACEVDVARAADLRKSERAGKIDALFGYRGHSAAEHRAPFAIHASADRAGRLVCSDVTLN